MIAAFLAAALLPQAAQAKFSRDAKVRYDTSDGRSDWYSVNVIFITGSELNLATTSVKYSSFKSYAVVFWSKEEASVIRLDEPTLFGCGTEFKESCLPIFGNMKGPDQQGRVWEVCTAMFCA
jgi:hypothetical protein